MRTKKRKAPKFQPAIVDLNAEKAQSPNLAAINTLVRALLLAITAGGLCSAIVQLYQLPVKPEEAFCAAMMWTTGFCLLLTLLKIRFAVPAALLLLFLTNTDIDGGIYKLSCLSDFFLIRLDSRLLYTSRFTERNPLELITQMDRWNNGRDIAQLPFLSGISGGFFLVVPLLCLILAVSSRTLRPGMSLLMALISVLPAIGAEMAKFVTGFIPLFCGMMGLMSMWAAGEAYARENVFSGITSLQERRQTRARERKRAAGTGGRFSVIGGVPKLHHFAGNAVIAFVCSLAAFVFTAYVIFPEENSAAISGAFSDMAKNIQRTATDLFSGVQSRMTEQPDTNGYFPNPSGIFETSEYLPLNGPSTGSVPVMNVTVSDNREPVYLRGAVSQYYDSPRNRMAVSSDSEENKRLETLMKRFFPEGEIALLYASSYLFRPVVNLQSGFDARFVTVEYLRPMSQVMLPTHNLTPFFIDDSLYSETFDRNVRMKRAGSVNTYSVQTLSLRGGGAFWSLNNYLSFASRLRYTPLEEYGEGAAELVKGSNHDASEYFMASASLLQDYEYGGTNDLSIPVLMDFIPSLDGNPVLPADYLADLAEYRRLIAAIYTKTAPEEADNISKLADRIGHFDNPVDAAQSAVDYFQDNFTYSLTTDNLSGGNTMLGNFLFETKAGHCALYAAAMTEYMRAEGFIARYVTGYVTGGNSTRVNGGYKFTLLERDLHAWVEVYLPYFGWTPFDPTPSIPPDIFEDGALTNQTVPTNTPQTPLPEKTTPDVTTAPVTTPADSTTESAGDSDNRPVLDIRIIIIIAAAVIAALLALAAIMLIKWRNRAERNLLRLFCDNSVYSRKNAVIISGKIFALLSMSGFVPQTGETPEGFGLRSGFSNVMTVIEKLEFSKEELSAEEYAALGDSAASLYEKAVTKQKAFTKWARQGVILKK